MDGWRRPLAALAIIMTVVALLLVVLGLMKEPSWFAGNGGNQTSSTITIGDNDTFANVNKSTEERLSSLEIVSGYNVLKAAKDDFTSPYLFLNVTGKSSVSSSHDLSNKGTFPRIHAILPHQNVTGYHEASVSSVGANDGKSNDSLPAKTNSEKERALMFGLTVTDSDAARKRQIYLNATHRKLLSKESTNIAGIEHFSVSSHWQKPRSILLKRHKRLGKRLFEDKDGHIKNISHQLQVVPVPNTYKFISMRISKENKDTLPKYEHSAVQVASVDQAPKKKIKSDVYLSMQATRSKISDHIKIYNNSFDLNVKNTTNNKFYPVKEQEFKNKSDSTEKTIKNSNNVEMILPKKRTQRMSYCSTDEYCLKQGYVACRQSRCQHISPPVEEKKRESIQTPDAQNIKSNTKEKLNFHTDNSKNLNNNHPFGYSPYTNKELPKVPNYPLKPSFAQENRPKFPPHTLPLLVIITVVMFIIFVVLAVVCAVKFVTSGTSQREEREHILGRGARPKTTRDFSTSSSSSSTNSGGRSRPPSYRAVAPPNYTQAQEQLRIPDATNTDVDGNQPTGTRQGQNQTFRDGTMPLRYSSAGEIINSRKHSSTSQVNTTFENVSENTILSRDSAGERIFNPPRLSSGTDDSFISADDFDSVSMKSETGNANRAHDIVRKVSSGPKGIHEPIYEEVFEEDDCRSAKSLPSGIERYAATAPMYENISSSKPGLAKSVDSLKQDDQVNDIKSSNIIKENKLFNNDVYEISSVAKEIQNQPENVTKKLIENQAQINNLMNELTKQIVKQKSKGSLYGERKSIQDLS